MQRLVLISVIAGSFLASIGIRLWFAQERPPHSSAQGEAPKAIRVVSLAPSATEVLFDLGLDDQVVGVTRFCDYPPAAQSKIVVGGYYDPNFERIVQLQPDLIVTLPEHEKIRAQLNKLNLQTLKVEHASMEGILTSINTIGNACGVAKRAKKQIQRYQQRLDRVEQATSSGNRPRVLVALGRPVEEESTRRVAVCGPNSIYGELIKRAGGVNAYADDVSYPLISAEGVVAIDPDVIIELVSDMEGQARTAEQIRQDWVEIPELTAVANDQVHVLGGDHLIVPGPRFVLLVEQLARIIHPNISWHEEGESHD